MVESLCRPPETITTLLIGYILNVLSRSVMSDSEIPWTIFRQTPLSMGFPRQEYWSGLPFPPTLHINSLTAGSQANLQVCELCDVPKTCKQNNKVRNLLLLP